MSEKQTPFQYTKYGEINYLPHVTVKSNPVYIIILAVLIATIISLPFIYIDVTTKSPASIESVESKKDIIAPISGRIDSLFIQENQFVNQNSMLLKITDEYIIKQTQLLKDRETQVQKYLSDIRTLFNNLHSKAFLILQTNQYQSDYDNLIAQLQTAQTKEDYAKIKCNRYQELYKTKDISAEEWESHTLDLKQAQNEVNTIVKRFQAKWQSEELQHKTEIFNIQQQLAQIEAEKDKLIVTANATGSILKMSGIQQGSYIQAGQKLAEISPNNNLIAVCLVSPKDIGFIHIGQALQLHIDAFNYNAWGAIQATVIEISKDVYLTDDKTPFFKIKAKLSKEFLQLKNGYKGNVIKGMTATASFMITKRSLWNLLFDKVDDWFNNTNTY